MPLQALLDAGPGEQVSFGLTFKGKDKGSVFLGARVDTQPQSGVQVVVVNVYKAKGLRDADMTGKNDVYVQVYLVPPDTPMPEKKKEHLPEPDKKAVLTAGQFRG